MKHLIIYAHPNEESLNGHFKDTIFEYLQNKNREIVVRDLYQMNFNPVLFFRKIVYSHSFFFARQTEHSASNFS